MRLDVERELQRDKTNAPLSAYRAFQLQLKSGGNRRITIANGRYLALNTNNYELSNIILMASGAFASKSAFRCKWKPSL